MKHVSLVDEAAGEGDDAHDSLVFSATLLSRRHLIHSSSYEVPTLLLLVRTGARTLMSPWHRAELLWVRPI